MYRVLSLFLLLSIMDLASGYYNPYPHYGHGFYPYHNGYHRQYFHHHDDYNDYQDHHHYNYYDDNVHKYSDHSEPSNIVDFEKIMEVLRGYDQADTTFENFCNDYSKVSPLITYGISECIYKYLIPENEVFNVEVRIIKKVLGVLVTMQDGDLKTDIRVLPDILNFSQADWSLSKRELIITIPYKVPLMTEFSAKCDTVNNDMIIVPKKSEPKFDFRMGE